MSVDEIKALKRKRGSIKSKLTIFSNFLKGLDTKDDLDLDDFHQLKTRLDLSENIIHEFNDVQENLEVIVDDANLEEQFKERELFCSLFYKEIARGKTLLSKLENNGEGVVLNNRNFEALSNVAIKLPAIEVPKFRGDYEGWLEFRETFESLVHFNNSLSSIHKYHYLKNSLTGNAAEVIASLEFSAVNYPIAWGLLCDRFNNSRLLVQNHIKAIFNIPVVLKQSSKILRNIIDTLSKHLKALKQLKQPADTWDTLIIYVINTKLDNTTVRDWEEYISKIDSPQLSDLKSFLKSKADLLETIELKNTDTKNQFKQNRFNTSKTFLTENADKGQDSSNVLFSNSNNNNLSKFECTFCKRSNHYIRNCTEFLKLTANERLDRVKQLRLCINCLRQGHKNDVCRLSNCRKCDDRHNTLLHISGPVDSRDKPSNVQSTSTTLTSYDSSPGSVILSTALVQIIDEDHKAHTIRAVLDSGSQSNFISSELCNKLKLKTTRINTAVAGINSGILNIDKKCHVNIHSQHTPFNTNISCLIIERISGTMPSIPINIQKLNIPKNIFLADASFSKPGPIDMLIGASLFYELLLIGQIKLGFNLPILQKTVFGWVVSGPIGDQNKSRQVVCNLSNNLDIQSQLAKFWEIEECNTKTHFSKEELLCEKHFKLNTKRDPSGRFIVSIPLKDSLEKLGESKTQAEKRLLALERKLSRDPSYKREYAKFMQEYEDLGHMRKITSLDTQIISYYMPHHGVFKQDSLTTKLRVVFDCSASTSTGMSMNDLQMVGPTIQNDLLSILLRFRTYSFVVTSDIAKMYRQVLINSEQCPLQRILWRYNSTDPISIYELQTVTYGTSSAAFLAIRCLFELAKECEIAHPDVSEVIRNDFYVDDGLFGGESIEELSQLCLKVFKILRSAGFILRKWHSNSDQIVKNINSNANPSSDIVKIGSNEATKTLGLAWSNTYDALTYNIGMISTTGRVTKRVILSGISQVFDPLGLLSPCVITIKILLQKLWLEKLSWDESVPISIHSSWLKFRDEISILNNLHINRHVTCRSPKYIEMHCFSDASICAYGSCIYIRSIDENGSIYVNLLCSKTKVAPLKVISVPKLELCGAVLAVRLAKRVSSAFRVNINEIRFWSDSTIVLGWLKHSPNLLKTFVANRVSEIQESFPNKSWRHVPTKQNPANILSRGISPKELFDCSLWWHGPYWLSESEDQWPNSQVVLNELPELKLQALIAHEPNLNPIIDFERFSNLNRLKRACAYLFRFIRNCQISHEKTIGPLTSSEINNAYLFLIRQSQQYDFLPELNALTNKLPISKRSKLFRLNPFLDKSGILRVGGRLSNADFHRDKQHPIIISAKHKLCKLIFKHEHVKSLHAGPQLLLSHLRETLWPIGGRNLAKSTVRGCVICFKCNPTHISPMMGDLPRRRLEGNFSFETCGVDYAGPFSIKDRKGRGCKITKCYLALFVCFLTKAVHLELVSDLSTNAFILALKRFISRRGKPVWIYSDNGTNFVGASAELNRQFTQYLCDNKGVIIDSCANEGIEWRFIPVNSPHFGGLWEAGVKSAKSHLKRIVGNNVLTFEEMCTVFIQVEAVLNSRPISPLTCDPNDLNPLTPAHFLVGRPLLATLETDITDVPEGRLTRYQLLEQMRQNFWTRWAKEYISELQQRTRWQTGNNPAKVGSLVLIKDDNLPPMKWRIGRVTQLHPGKDGVCRVVSIQVSQGIIKRACQRICPLPIENNPSNPVSIESNDFQGGGHVGAVSKNHASN